MGLPPSTFLPVTLGSQTRDGYGWTLQTLPTKDWQLLALGTTSPKSWFDIGSFRHLIHRKVGEGRKAHGLWWTPNATRYWSDIGYPFHLYSTLLFGLSLLLLQQRFFSPEQANITYQEKWVCQTTAYLKSPKEKLIEDLNYLGRKENIYWITMNFKTSNVLVLLLVTIYVILEDLKVWSDCEALFQIS